MILTQVYARFAEMYLIIELFRQCGIFLFCHLTSYVIATSQWFIPDTPRPTKKTDCHNIAELIFIRM